MAFVNFRKESSERSDSDNWTKQKLILETLYYFDSIEGCNQNTENIVTHLFERSRIDFDVSIPHSTEKETLDKIINLESLPVLQRKINFALAFNIELSYVLYCDEVKKVWLYTIHSADKCEFINEFDTYESFSNWLSEIKGWKSTKKFREIDDLPYFDKELRKAGTAWPTNIDCFISDLSSNPIGILEFQNANNTSVALHCNNDFFLCKQSFENFWGHIDYRDDIRRWISQEILRVQSNLRLFVITWSKKEDDFILKEIEIITFPNLPYSKNWGLNNQYKADLHKFANTKSTPDAVIIANKYSSYNLKYINPIMQTIVNNPPLHTNNKTFPHIYYSYKQLIQGKKEELVNLFNGLF